MKLIHNKSLLAVIIFMSISYFFSQGAIHESLAFPADDMTLTTDTINGEVYCRVSYCDTYNNGITAQPSLPVKYYTFSIPWNATNISVSADILDYNLISSPAKVFPMQALQVTNSSTPISFTQPDSLIYNTNAFFPSNITKITGEGYYLGDNHVITIAVHPIQYNPITHTLKVNNEIYLNISYSLVDKSALPKAIVSRNNSKLREDGINKTKALVFNSSSVENYATPFSPTIMPSSTNISLVHDYLIITSNELKPAFERLVAFKRAKGYNAGIVTMEEILDCETYNAGDLVSSIPDDAGKLRAYLSNAYMCGTRYVLLGGKEPHVPIRFGKGSWTSKIPTDLYFSDINGNWNADNDLYYGEEDFINLDYFPDLYVGRLLCKNINEVNNYIDKLLIYELNPGNGDFQYLQRSFIIDADEMEKNNEANYIATESQSIFPYATIKHGSTDYSSGVEIISDLNSTNYGFYSFHGHGNPGAIKLCGKAGIGAIDNDHYRDWYITKESGNALDCLTNKYFPNICYSISCTVMPYDIYSEYDVSYNFGESFTLGKNYGGVAFLGNTRYGFYDKTSSFQTSAYLENCFIDQLKKGNFKIGIAEANSKSKDFSPALTEKYDHDIRLAHNLLGDPEFEIWTNIPEKYTDADIDIFKDEQNIVISGQCLEGKEIVVINTNGDIFTQTGEKNGSTYFNVSPNSSIMIYKHNMIPYIPTLCLQNENITYSQHIFAKDVKMGSMVDGNRSYGNISFSNNVNYIIDATGDVEINSGFIVKNTGKVTINTPGTVTIKGGEIQDGGSFTINASNILIDGNFIVSKISNVIFNEIK